ncbi:MAG: helix-turn-helix transcriptional regulator [Haloarculaceae archaeon]
MYELTGFQRDLLFVINSLGPANGQEIRERVETSRERTLSRTRLYGNLDELAARDLVEKTYTGGRTNLYVATDRGRNALRTRLEWEEQYLSPSLV